MQNKEIFPSRDVYNNIIIIITTIKMSMTLRSSLLLCKKIQIPACKEFYLSLFILYFFFDHQVISEALKRNDDESE